MTGETPSGPWWTVYDHLEPLFKKPMEGRGELPSLEGAAEAERAFPLKEDTVWRTNA